MNEEWYLIFVAFFIKNQINKLIIQNNNDYFLFFFYILLYAFSRHVTNPQKAIRKRYKQEQNNSSQTNENSFFIYF